MKKNIKFLIISCLVCLLAFPFGQSVFAMEKQNSGQTHQQVAATGAGQAVIVSTVSSPEAEIKVALIAGECEKSELTSGQTFVQDPVIVDFNKPADCFVIKAGEVAFQEKLEVQPLYARLPDIKVKNNVAHIGSEKIRSSRPLPESSILTTATGVIGQTKSIQAIVSHSVAIISIGLKSSLPLTSERLMIWRC